MSIEAETILLATGLIAEPERTHVRAGPELLKELRTGLADVLDREDPAGLTVYPERKRYFDRLSVEPDYASLLEDVAALVGDDVADAYVLAHQRARRALLDARPRITIETVMGPLPMPLDSISEGRWELLVDVVESARIVKDIAAGGLLKEEVDMFQAAFPGIYAELREQLNERLAARAAREEGWMPAPWLASSLLVFEGRKPGETLSAAAGAEPEKSSAGGSGTKEVKVSKIVEDLHVASRKVM